jgi:hypothetical protein
MICPNCGAEQPEPAPRFCDACAVALPRLRVAQVSKAAPETRCLECGLPATGARCRGCGAKVSVPVGQDEDERKPLPKLRVPTGDG